MGQFMESDKLQVTDEVIECSTMREMFVKRRKEKKTEKKIDKKVPKIERQVKLYKYI